MEYDIILIEWADAVGVNDVWFPLSEMQDEAKVSKIYSIGFLTKETKTLVQISPHYDTAAKNVVGCIAIPVSQIRSRKVLLRKSSKHSKKGKSDDS